MWHIMLCVLLALPAFSDFDLREKNGKALLTEQNCESCATCAKCAKNNVNDASKSEIEPREIDEMRECAKRRRFGWQRTGRPLIRRR